MTDGMRRLPLVTEDEAAARAFGGRIAWIDVFVPVRENESLFPLGPDRVDGHRVYYTPLFADHLLKPTGERFFTTTVIRGGLGLANKWRKQARNRRRATRCS